MSDENDEVRESVVESLACTIGEAIPFLGGNPFEAYAAVKAVAYGLRKAIGDKFPETLPRFDQADEVSSRVCAKHDVSLAAKEARRS